MVRAKRLSPGPHSLAPLTPALTGGGFLLGYGLARQGHRGRHRGQGMAGDNRARQGHHRAGHSRQGIYAGYSRQGIAPQADLYGPPAMAPHRLQDSRQWMHPAAPLPCLTKPPWPPPMPRHRLCMPCLSHSPHRYGPTGRGVGVYFQGLPGG